MFCKAESKTLKNRQRLCLIAHHLAAAPWAPQKLRRLELFWSTAKRINRGEIAHKHGLVTIRREQGTVLSGIYPNLPLRASEVERSSFIHVNKSW